MRPLIGITVDNKDNSIESGRYESSITYSRAVTAAGGTPILLPHQIDQVQRYVELCDGFIFTGGVDPRTEDFGEPTHSQATPMDETRQAFELALLAATHHYTEKPVLGVCLGMQLMALSAGGRLDQHMPDTIGDQAAGHINDSRHTIEINGEDSVLNAGISIDGCQVVSRHHQAVADAGSLRVIATSPDGVIEAIDDPGRPFFLGVQWHPERGGEGVINQGLIQRFVSACRSAT